MEGRLCEGCLGIVFVVGFVGVCMLSLVGKELVGGFGMRSSLRV